MTLIDPGRKAPAFTLADQHGTVHALADYADRPVILYFYPKDDTSVCTKEACAFRDTLPKFEGAGAAVLGISPDDESSHAAFARKYDLSFPLLADVKRTKDGAPAVCLKYGVWGEKSMYGRTYLGVVRTTYLLAPGGKVAQRWDKVRVPGHAAQVLRAVQALG